MALTPGSEPFCSPGRKEFTVLPQRPRGTCKQLLEVEVRLNVSIRNLPEWQKEKVHKPHCGCHGLNCVPLKCVC